MLADDISDFDQVEFAKEREEALNFVVKPKEEALSATDFQTKNEAAETFENTSFEKEEYPDFFDEVARINKPTTEQDTFNSPTKQRRFSFEAVKKDDFENDSPYKS